MLRCAVQTVRTAQQPLDATAWEPRGCSSCGPMERECCRAPAWAQRGAARRALRASCTSRRLGGHAAAAAPGRQRRSWRWWRGGGPRLSATLPVSAGRRRAKLCRCCVPVTWLRVAAKKAAPVIAWPRGRSTTDWALPAARTRLIRAASPAARALADLANAVFATTDRDPESEARPAPGLRRSGSVVAGRPVTGDLRLPRLVRAPRAEGTRAGAGGVAQCRSCGEVHQGPQPSGQRATAAAAC